MHNVTDQIPNCILTFRLALDMSLISQLLIMQATMKQEACEYVDLFLTIAQDLVSQDIDTLRCARFWVFEYQRLPGEYGV